MVDRRTFAGRLLPRPLMITALLVAASLVAAACGSTGGDSSVGGEETAPEVPDATEEAPGGAEDPGEDSEDGGEEPDDAADAEHSYEDGDVLRVVIPVGPGGGYDVQITLLTEALQPELQQLTGTDVIVQREYMPGGAHLTGMQHVAHAEPDGRTILYATPVEGVRHRVIEGEDIDFREFTPLGSLAQVTTGYVARADLELESWDLEGLAARSQEQSILIGHPSPEPQMRIMFGLFSENGIDVEADYVTYDSTAEVGVALLRGEIDMGMSSTIALSRAVDDNPDELRFFAHGGCERLAALPDLQTLVEMGAPEGETVCSALHTERRALFGPPGFPAGDAAVLTEALRNVITDPAFVAEFEAATAEPPGWQEPEELAEYVDVLISMWEANAHFLQ